MNRLNRIFSGGIIYHLLVIVLLVIPHAFYSSYIAKKDMTLYFLNILVIDGLLLLIIYINIFYLIPVFLKQKKYLIYILLIVPLLVIFIYVSYIMTVYIQVALKFPDEPLIYFIISTIVNAMQYLLFSFFLFNMKEKFAQEKKMGAIQLENLRTEINYLKAQINPHFLFNTLNNLYALALEKSDKTPEIVMRLSRMMDYMLYETDDAMVSLEKDIDNIENYIAIERIRQGNNAVINFKQEGKPVGQKIVPLLLLPLIENGFKHGINTQINNAFLDIELIVTSNSITLTVINNYKEVKEEIKEKRNGIGLINLKRRLELFYPGKYQLQINKSDNRFEITLNILLQ